MSYLASRSLHGAMAKAIFHTPMRILDTTPVGRFLTRFSEDINVQDTRIPEYCRESLFFFSTFVGIMVLVIILQPVRSLPMSKSCRLLPMHSCFC